jgi:hypothetical protein
MAPSVTLPRLTASALGRRAVCVGVTIGALLTMSCGSSSETTTGPSIVKCAVQMQSESTGFPPAGGSGTLSITTSRECTWSAQSDVPWLTLGSPASGQGDGSVKFTVGTNAEPSARSAHISIKDQQLQISQQGAPCELRLSSTRESIGPAGGTRSVHVDASNPQCSWTATAQVSWISITDGRSGTGDGAVSFRVAAADGSTRTGTLTIGGRTVTVVQAPGCAVDVDPRTFTAPVSGGPGTIRVQASEDCTWTAQSDNDWIAITAGSSGTGPGQVRFTVRASDGPSRTGAIHIADQTITVGQGSGCTVSVNPTSLNVGAQTTTETIHVEGAAGCGWTATSQASWITVASGAAGSGDGAVGLNIATNSGPRRTGSVTIGSRTVAVTQSEGCDYSVTPQRVDLPGIGGTATLTIDTGAGCSWTAATDTGWIGVSARSGTGPGQLQVSAAQNSSPPRSGTLAVAGRSVTVNQASPCTFVLAPRSADYDANGGGGAILVIVTGGCSWTSVSDAGWIKITLGESGSGEGLVEFTVAPNTGSARTGFLTIAGLQFRVRQAAR